uniref:Uncharacterized protein n=1 Tax=Arion vulgaris TaxID=1028688 RepID=A0A0B6Y805_9EUPU
MQFYESLALLSSKVFLISMTRSDQERISIMTLKWRPKMEFNDFRWRDQVKFYSMPTSFDVL